MFCTNGAESGGTENCDKDFLRKLEAKTFVHTQHLSDF
jgi:hypothetical protein